MIQRALVTSTAVFLASCTCGSTPMIHATVVDLWDNPVELADVSVEGTEGVEGKITTNADGKFEIPTAPEVKISLSREGIVPHTTTVKQEKEAADTNLTIKVVPVPETPGFHLVGPDSYLPLSAQPVVRVGTQLKTWHGIQSAGDFDVKGTPFRVVYHAPNLKLDEIARLNIELHRLTFVESTKVDSVDGPAEVNVNLWTSGGEVEVVREGLGDNENYVYRVDELPPGTYAFASQDLLNPKGKSYDSVAASVRNVHAFTIK